MLDFETCFGEIGVEDEYFSEEDSIFREYDELVNKYIQRLKSRGIYFHDEQNFREAIFYYGVSVTRKNGFDPNETPDLVKQFMDNKLKSFVERVERFSQDRFKIRIKPIRDSEISEMVSCDERGRDYDLYRVIKVRLR
jgi:uncharacterized protein (UPF0335 family)